MTREEQIKRAAEQFADREHGAMRDVSVFNLLQYAFKCGAEWVDNNNLKHLWHDASEMPQGDKWDILCYGRGYMLADEYCFTEPEFVKDHEIQQWAYLDDLLPSDNVPSTK